MEGTFPGWLLSVAVVVAAATGSWLLAPPPPPVDFETSVESRRSQLQATLRRPTAAKGGATHPPVRTVTATGLVVERGTVQSEDSSHSQASVPYKLVLPGPRHAQAVEQPLVFVLHGTSKHKSCPEVAEVQQRWAQTFGWSSVSVDLRYHGERHGNTTSVGPEPSDELTPAEAAFAALPAADRLRPYYEALSESLRQHRVGAAGPREYPFIYDSAWDLSRVLDTLLARSSELNVDPSRVGITGISLGGMVAWFAAAADPRFAVVAPAIGVQGFQWAVDHGRFHARVSTLQPVFDAAAAARYGDTGASVDAATVADVWDAIAPGLRSEFDARQSLPLIAPRPLLVINGELDPRCPADGVREELAAARQEAPSQWPCELHLEPHVGHAVTPAMWTRIDRFFASHFESPTQGVSAR